MVKYPKLRSSVEIVAKVIDSYDPRSSWTTIQLPTVLRIFVSGLIVGLATYVVYILLERFVFTPILCGDSASNLRCDAKDNFANGIAVLIGSMLGIVLLVRERVYRPMLAVLGVAASLWTVTLLTAAMPIVFAALLTVLVFGASYVLFSWLVQPSSLVVSIVAVVLVTALARIATTL